MKRRIRIVAALSMAAAFLLMNTPMPAASAPCLADHPPNDRPANSQSVPPEFCVSGAAGQHYYLWKIPSNLDGKVWKLKLEALSGEDTRLMVQSLDHDPHQGAFNFKTLWSGASTSTTSEITSSALALKPGLYGVVVATRQPPGLYRLYVTSAQVAMEPLAAASIASALPAATMPAAPAANGGVFPAAIASPSTAQAPPPASTSGTAQITAEKSRANAYAPASETAASPMPPGAAKKQAAPEAGPEKADEIEPNDDPSVATPISLGSSRDGLNDRDHDNDYYHFALLGPTHVRLTLTSPGTARHMYLFWGDDTIQRISKDAAAMAPAVWDGTLDAGDYYVDVFADSTTTVPYRLQLQTADPFAQSASRPLNLSAHLVFDNPHVAAHVPNAQMVLGRLDVMSSAGKPLDLSVMTYAADERWHIAANKSSLHLETDGKGTLAVAVRVAPDALADYPVQVALGLRDANGNHATASTILFPQVSAPSVSPSPSQDIPARLAGGLNVAWSALGAKSLDNHPQLIDGLANYGSSVELGVDKAGTALTIALAGSTPAHLVGFVFIPAPWESVGRRLHGFRVLASVDGKQFTPLLSGDLSPRDAAQYFVLPKAVDAHILKLVPLDAQYPQSLSIALGDFEAIADPASAPLGNAGFEISSLLRGGHMVLSDPYPYYPGAMLSDDPKSSSGVGIPAGHKDPVSWVVGFLDDRPARIDWIDWRYSSNESPSDAIPSVDVYNSLDSPNGPWTKLGTWRISPTGDSTPFRPPGAPLVRYLRFDAAATKNGVVAVANKSSSSADLPQHLSVHEMPAAGNYHSVLSLAAQTGQVSISPISGPSAPRTLSIGKLVTGSVRLDTRTDCWLLDLPAGTQNLTLTLNNKPAIGAVASMKSSDGKAIALTEQTSDVETRRYSAQVAAGRYEVDVSEPPRSIALLWDTSGSTSGWKPAIIAAVRSIAQGVSPGRDEVNLFPFRDPLAQPLLKAYSGDPAVVLSALKNYDWKDSSSAAEGALIGALQTLADRPGRRGIIMLTDAETSSANLTPQLWQAIAKTGVQIFTLQVSTNSNGEYAWATHDLMMDWASTTGGFHTMLGNPSDAEAAFKRAAATLRGWAPYSLTVTEAAAPLSPVAPPPPAIPPAPGKLSVVFAPSSPLAPVAKQAPRDAIALVLDASGSMQQTLHSRSKIDIARGELDHLVRDVIPEGTPITLRVYGQRGRGSCRSDLMIPLAPLDRGSAEAIVSKVRSTRGARTATAASLHATAADLAAVQGPKRVILITDGEENCGGNVETEIGLLKKSGFDVELDIVGFAVDTPRTGKTFARWAQLGGGKYFEASDASTLDSAVRAAVIQRFDVLDAESNVVASGEIGGDAVTLPPGHYFVQLHGQPKVSVDVDVKPNAAATAVLPR